jgi:light-regulated signal transduction histidine kinase (bacteriophytochrome)
VEWRVDALPEVRGDGEALRLVLTHLIANALKFTRGRDVARVDVRCDETDTEWLVEVHDNGVGFDDRYVDRLFGVFQRLHTEDEFEGHGVGLALVRRVVSRHGGRTWAKSRGSDPHAGGATFGFSLPKPRLPDRSHD